MCMGMKLLLWRRNINYKSLLRITFGPKRDKISEQFRMLHNEELYDVCRFPGIVEIVKARKLTLSFKVCIQMGWKCLWNWPFGRQRCWKDNIKMYLREMSCKVLGGGLCPVVLAVSNLWVFPPEAYLIVICVMCFSWMFK